MLLRDIRDKMDITSGLSREEFVIRCYACDIFKELLESKNLVIFDDVEDLGTVTENNLLLGYWDWQMYSENGNSLIWTDDITMRLYGKERIPKEELDVLTGGRSILSVQADALEKAAQFVLVTLKEATDVRLETNA